MDLIDLTGRRRGSQEGPGTILTDDELHSKLVLAGFVRTIETNLDLELLSSTDDEMLRVVVAAAVLLLVDFLFLSHHVNVRDVKELWVDGGKETRLLFETRLEKNYKLLLLSVTVYYSPASITRWKILGIYPVTALKVKKKKEEWSKLTSSRKWDFLVLFFYLAECHSYVSLVQNLEVVALTRGRRCLPKKDS